MGSTVRAATITLTVTNASPTSYALYEVKRPWSEAQATWNAAATGSSWQAGGAEGATDRGTTLLGTVQATAHGSLTVTLNAAGVAVVQKWVSTPSSNHGFVIASTTATDGIAFAAREVTTTSQRPRLDVGYDTTSGSNDGGVDASRADAAGTDAGKADAGVDSGGGPGGAFSLGTIFNASGAPRARPATVSHVIVSMFENKNYSSVMGSANAPYMNSIKTQCGYSTQFVVRALRHLEPIDAECTNRDHDPALHLRARDG